MADTDYHYSDDEAPVSAFTDRISGEQVLTIGQHAFYISAAALKRIETVIKWQLKRMKQEDKWKAKREAKRSGVK